MKRQQIGVCSRSHLILFLNKVRIKMTTKEAISEERKGAIGVSIEKKPHAWRTGYSECEYCDGLEPISKITNRNGGSGDFIAS